MTLLELISTQLPSDRCKLCTHNPFFILLPRTSFVVNYKGFPQIRLTFCDDVARIKSAAERQMQECHRHRRSSESILGKAAAPRYYKFITNQ